MALVHHHLIYQARVSRGDLGENGEEELKTFLLSLVREIDMEVLIEPRLKFSHQRAWTGLVGIVTSHIALHFWSIEQYVQLDIYSCKQFDRPKAVKFLDSFWQSRETKTLFIDREVGRDFKIES